MRKVVDLCKQSKKAQKAFYAAQRGSWNGINPVSRVVPNGKAYSRAKAKADARRDACRPFFALNSSYSACIGYTRRTIWGDKPKSANKKVNREVLQNNGEKTIWFALYQQSAGHPSRAAI